MAIQYFCGRPGSGKSYGVIENVLLPALTLGRPIYTNIPLNLVAISEDYPDTFAGISVFTNDDMDDSASPGDFLMTIPGGAVIIIDECWRWWSSGVKVTDIPKLDKEFFAEHRHKVGEGGLTQEIVLVSQAPSQIAKYLRDLIDQTVLTIKNNAAGSSKTFTVKIYSACIPSIDRPGEAQTTGLGTYKPAIYKYYQSHTKSETGLPGIEIRADKRLSVWNHWYIRYVAPVILVGAIWGAYTFYDLYHNNSYAKPKSVSVQAPASPASPVYPSVPSNTQAVIVPVVQAVVYSKRYRIAGTAIFNGRLKVYIHDATTKHLRTMNAVNCKTGDFNETECKIDGELVTVYSGTREAEKKEKSFTDIAPTVQLQASN
ncbi:zonular occludens toxin domain-containing protein [Methylobacter sp. S3L5C]|uniref:zonular occludens toxin domain-containing protein n=1 Tax=Methylobacter sp. S3L5C TaxID=2839024 RepID=UPI001FAD94C2|nr:zonular occludens toxin domain-containing protein [Methylobacter sp. S3L5C]UOA07523.1 hypothetical protein KKZ03_14775 [Methylobacter sp. S3L5C]